MTPELQAHLDSSLLKLEEAGVSLQGTKELPFGIQLRLEGSGKHCAVNLYHSAKKGPSVVGSGGDRQLLDKVLRILSHGPAEKEPMLSGIRTGTDEAGKGDYFGPLVAAAVRCGEGTAARLLDMGAGDSKRLSAAVVRDLFQRITLMKEVVYSVCTVTPAEYNSLFAGFSSRGMNSLDIQAMAHGKAIAGVLERTGNTGTVVIDRFCSMNRLKPWLPDGLGRIELMTGAEDREPAVAAASIIARSVYLQQLEAISSSCGVELRPGAGDAVDRNGRRLVRLRGDGILVQTAKLHFSNTVRITSGLDLG